MQNQEGWSNWKLGKEEGCQAKGVVRQRIASFSSKIVDMTTASVPFDISNEDVGNRKLDEHRTTKECRDHKKKDKKEKKEKKDKKSSLKEKKRKREKDEESSGKKKNSSFNPLLQFFATRLSDTTLSFQKK
jgi:hypothetical protein